MTKKSSGSRKSRRSAKVLARLRKAESGQRHVRLRLRDADPVGGFVVGIDDKRVELAVLDEPGRPDGVVQVRLRDVEKVSKVPAPEAASALRGRFTHLEEVEELAQAVVDEAFEEGWPYDAQGTEDLTDLQRAIRELACVVRRPEPAGE